MFRISRIIQGSVKDKIIREEPTRFEYGEGDFLYTNRWSCFDWAHGPYKMPNDIPRKGVAQCLIGAYFFERLEDMGIPTTYIGLVDPVTDQILDLPDELKPTNRMRIEIARVIKPEEMDGDEPTYAEYLRDLRSAVIPMEVMFRFGLPPGSSAFRRMKSGNCDPDLFGLSEIPDGNEPIWFGVPRLDYSTKFDPRGDVYDLGRDFYREICGLSETEMTLLDRMTQTIAYMLFQEYRKIGMELWDGKFEYVFGPMNGDRTIVVGDAVGAPDEVRLLRNGQQWSKEFGRQIYRRTQPEWVATCTQENREEEDWQQDVLDRGLSPRPLTQTELDLFSGIYTSLTNALWGEEVIEGSPTIEEVGREYDNYMIV